MLLKSTIAVAALVALVFGSAEAAPKGSKAPGPSTVKASSAKAPKAAKTSGAPKAPKTTAPKGGPKASASTKTAKADTAVTRTETGSKSKKASTDAAIPTGSTTLSGVDFTTGKVGERLSHNSALRSKLETQLRALGYEGTVYQAGYGFKNQGQFVAALNNAQNHGLTFEQLKLQMTGLAVDSQGVVMRANLNPDGTVTMVPWQLATNPAPISSLGQAKKTLATQIPEAAPRSASR